MIRRFCALLPPLLLLLLLASAARAEDWAGEYSSDRLALLLKANGTLFEGTFTIKGKPYPVLASLKGEKLKGTFTAGETAFAFEATLTGETLTLLSDGKSYTLTRKREAVNPLDALGDETPASPPPPPPVHPPANPPVSPPVNPPTNPAPPPPATPPAQKTPVQTQAIATLRALPAAPADPNRRWTILVYLDADNNLEAPGVADFNEMELGIPPEGVEVIVLIDRAKGYSDADGDWTDARLCRIRRDGDMEKMNSPILARLGEVNMGDPDLLAAFLEGGFRAYPAPRTMCVLWNHGGGWAAMASDDDDGAGGHDGLDLVKMSAAFSQGLPAAGVKRLDLLGFDMCLMAQLETATEAAPFAHIMIASQALEPGAGWPYDLVLPLFADSTAEAPTLGPAITAAYDAYYDAKKDRSTTCSCVDLDRVPEVVGRLNDLLTKLRPSLAQEWPTFARALFFSESYMGRSDFRKGEGGVNSLDLADVLRRFRHNLKPFPAEAEYAALSEALGKMVLATRVNSERRLSTGLSVYGPVTRKAASPAYFGIAFSQICRWPNFLVDVFKLQAADVTPPTIQQVRTLDNDGNEIGAIQPLAGHQFEGVITGKNIIWTMVQDGVRDAKLGGLRVYGRSILLDDLWILRYEQAAKEATHELDLLLPVYKDGETKVRTEFEGLIPRLTNGTDKVPATFDVAGVDPGGAVTAQVLLEHRGLSEKPVLAVVAFDPNTWEVRSIVLLNTTPEGKVQPRALDLESVPPDLLVRGVEELVKEDGTSEFVAGDSIPWGGGIRMCMELAEAGDYEALLTVETMGDVSSTSRVRYKVTEDPQLTAFAQGWQLFKPEHMVGTWDLFILDESDTPKPTGRLYRLENHPDSPGRYRAHVEGPGADERQTETWIVDLAGFPNIRMIVHGETPEDDSLLIAPALFGITEGKGKILGKMVAIGGMLWVWEKREPVKSDLDRIQPVDVPEPEPLR